MNCDYCGLATDTPARWEAHTGLWPGDGMTRYVCDNHLAAACRHIGDEHEVHVTEIRRQPVAVAA